MLTVLKTEGDGQKKAMNEAEEKLQVLEENMKNFDPSFTCINGANMGVLDIMLCSFFGDYKVSEEVLGIKALDPEKTPLVCSWVEALHDVPVVKETRDPHEKLVGFLKFMRQNVLKSSALH